MTQIPKIIYTQILNSCNLLSVIALRCRHKESIILFDLEIVHLDGIQKSIVNGRLAIVSLDLKLR